jgi:hypothetical protein
MKYILRTLALPFIAAVSLIGAIKMWIVICKNFLLYGGEVVTYTKAHTDHTIGDLMNLITDKFNSEQNPERSVARDGEQRAEP